MEGGNFEGCDFSFADLNLQMFEEAIYSLTSLAQIYVMLFTMKTQWLDGFNPLDHGAIPVEWLPSDPVYEEDKE